MPRAAPLFDETPRIDGLIFREEFITADEEFALVSRIRALDFQAMKMRGVVARRRVIHYGVNYSFQTFKARPGPPIPEFQLSQAAGSASALGP